MRDRTSTKRGTTGLPRTYSRLFITILLLTTVLGSVSHAVTFSAMTTKPTEYYSRPDLKQRAGSLPPGFMITILAIDMPAGTIKISFENGAGKLIRAYVAKDIIEPSFYETPEPIIPDTPTPYPTYEPTPIPSSVKLVTLKKKTAAYDRKNPKKIIGYFPAGAEILALSNGPSQKVHVTYNSPRGRTIKALCLPGDLDPNTPLPTPTPTPEPLRQRDAKSDDEQLAWYEGYSGWKHALSIQRKTRQPMLIYLYFDWSDDCEMLSDELLLTSKFIKASKNIIKLRINPSHGKQEQQLANKFKMTSIPTVLIADEPSDTPRKLKLMRKMYGKTKVMDLKRAMKEITAPPPPPKPVKEKQRPKHWK